jgi:hypothetical protein
MRTVFNRRASSYHLIAWKKGAKSVYGDEMLNLADGVIAIWKENRSLSFVQNFKLEWMNSGTRDLCKVIHLLCSSECTSNNGIACFHLCS